MPPSRAMSTSRIEVRVRYAETDRMGRAHHTHHLVWCEAGRTAWLEERGVRYADLEEEGVFLPVSRVSVEYRRPAGYDDRVEVETRLSGVKSRTVSFAYALRRVHDGALVATAETELICVDPEGRVRSLPAGLRELLSGEAGEGAG